MKRLIALLLVLAMMAPFASADVITSAVFLNGQELSFTDDKGMALSPVLMNGRLYAPAEELGRQLYVEVKADPKRLTLTVAGKPMAFKAGGQDVPAVLVACQGAYTFGVDSRGAVHHAKVLDEAAFLAYHTIQLDPGIRSLGYRRKHK